jgi:signal peptidase I
MNFALILFLLTLVTGILWSSTASISARAARPMRRSRHGSSTRRASFRSCSSCSSLRSFVAEPFKIPSSSMRPTLEVGDFHPGQQVRLRPSAADRRGEVPAVGEPQRGDVVVFRYPVNPSQDFIKRVVGVGGDVVSYQDKKLTVNGQPLPQVRDGTYSYLENLRFETIDRYKETTRNAMAATEYTIGINPAGRARVSAERAAVSGPRELRIQ